MGLALYMTDQFEIASATGINVQLNIAGPGARSYAFVVDWHIRILIALAWFVGANLSYMGSLVLLETGSPNYGVYSLIVFVPAFVIYFLYHPILEVVMAGRTPGKRMAGVRIVTENAQVPSVFAILIRNVLRLLDSLPVGYVIGLATAVFTEKSVRIGDIAAGTVLVYESDNRADNKRSFDLNPAAVSQHGLAKVELAQEILARWDTLDMVKRATLARRAIVALQPDAVPAVREHRLKQQLESMLGERKAGSSVD